MKKMTLCSLFACFSYFLAAQSVALDSTFGNHGLVITGLNGNAGSPFGIDFVGLPNGKAVIGGSISNSIGLEQYDKDGIMDLKYSTFQTPSDGYEIGMTIQKDGKVLMTSENLLGLNTFVARIDTFGKLDPSFGIGGIAQTEVSHFMVHNVFEQSDGRIIVFGDERTSFSAFSAVRLMPDGSIDSDFANQGKLFIDLPNYTHEVPIAVAEQADHKLVFAGIIGFPVWNIMILRVNPDGTLDSTFGNGGILIDPVQGSSDAYALALQPDGKIVIAGDTDPVYQAIVVRYNSDGTRDANFANQGVQFLPELNEGLGIAVKPDGKILSLNWDWQFPSNGIALVQLQADGQLDPSFGDNGTFRVLESGIRPRALALVGNKVTVSARKQAGTSRKRLYRFSLDLNVGTINPNTPADPNLWIYPNPISEQFNLQFTLTQKAAVRIQLFDMQGKLVQSLQENQLFDSGAHTLNLSCPEQLPSGNYVLTLEVAGEKRSSVQVLKR